MTPFFGPRVLFLLDIDSCDSENKVDSWEDLSSLVLARRKYLGCVVCFGRLASSNSWLLVLKLFPGQL